MDGRFPDDIPSNEDLCGLEVRFNTYMWLSADCWTGDRSRRFEESFRKFRDVYRIIRPVLSYRYRRQFGPEGPVYA